MNLFPTVIMKIYLGHVIVALYTVAVVIVTLNLKTTFAKKRYIVTTAINIFILNVPVILLFLSIK